MKRILSGNWMPANNGNHVRMFVVSVFPMSREA